MKKRELSSKVSCGHCTNIAPMEILGCVGDIEIIEDDMGSRYEQGDYYEVLKCPACNKVNIRTYWWAEHMESEEDTTYHIIFPKDDQIPLGLPLEIQSAYEKANKVKPIDAEFYALALRKVLELVCRDKKAKGKVLADQIKDLAARGELPNNLVKVAVGLKNFGNIGAHTGASLTKKEVPIAEALCKAVLEYIYSAPHLAQVAENSLTLIKSKSTKT